MRTDFERSGALRRLRAIGRSGSARQLRMRGVTLIELMIVIAVLAIISTIAVSSYRKYLLRANRTDGTTALLRVQVAEEKYFLQNNAYTDDISKLGLTTPTPMGYYTLSVAAGDSTNIATSFLATVTAQTGQLKDTDCQTLTINDKGLRNSSPGATSLCWK